MGKRKGFNAASPVIAACGALTRSVDDQVLFYQAIWNRSLFEADRTVVPLYFNELMFSQT